MPAIIPPWYFSRHPDVDKKSSNPPLSAKAKLPVEQSDVSTPSILSMLPVVKKSYGLELPLGVKPFGTVPDQPPKWGKPFGGPDGYLAGKV
jgi:hypothetical protein